MTEGRRGGRVSVLLAGAVLAMPLSAAGIGMRGIMAKPVDLGAKAGTVDDVLVAVAESTGANVVCDATHVDQKLDTTDLRGPLLHVLMPLEAVDRVAVSEWDATTLLFWGMPDLAALAPAGQGGAVTTLGKSIPQADLGAQVRAWLDRLVGEDGGPGLQMEVPVTDLPEELGDAVVAYAQSEVLGAPRQGQKPTPGVFHEEFWQLARIWSRHQVEAGRPIAMFRFGVRKAPGGWSHTIGWEM